jgi:hypothetical protein
MSKSQIESSGLFLAVLGALVVLSLSLTEAYAWLGSICGLSLVLILLGYDRDGYRTVFESLAFSAVFSLAFTIAIATPLRMFVGSMSQPADFLGRVSNQWMPLIWVFVTAVFCPIDRARMSSRVVSVPTSPFVPAPTAFTPPPPAFVPVATPVEQAPVTFSPPPPPAFVPEPPRPVVRETVPVAPPAPPPQPSARATFTRPAFSEPAPAPVAAPPPPPSPPAVYPVMSSQQPVAQMPPAAPQMPMAAPQVPPPAPASIPPQPQSAPQVAPIPPGKETMIYVTLVGEGLNVLRAVRAEHLGRDFYRIADEMPEGETWQWGPGQVVRCKKKNLSSGKAMVAFEEAQRAR